MTSISIHCLEEMVSIENVVKKSGIFHKNSSNSQKKLKDFEKKLNASEATSLS